MKISGSESGKARVNFGALDEKILPAERPRRHVGSSENAGSQLSPLEKGMLVAETALEGVPDTREDIVNELKAKIQKGEYNVSGSEIADMMLRRLEADKIR